MTPSRRTFAALAACLLLVCLPGSSSPAPLAEKDRYLAPGYGTYAWPVQGAVIRGFEPPPDPYSAGHRGIDIAAPFGSYLLAAQAGVVAFAGWVGGALFISIDHDDGVRTTYSWLSGVSVVRGQVVIKKEFIGWTGHGHPDVVTPHLHFGARVGETYIDPMLLLEKGSVVGLIHLAPLEDPPGVSPFGDLVPFPLVTGDAAQITGRAPCRSGPVATPRMCPVAHLLDFRSHQERAPPRGRAAPSSVAWVIGRVCISGFSGWSASA
jgi:Peptidase family M23